MTVHCNITVPTERHYNEPPYPDPPCHTSTGHAVTFTQPPTQGKKKVALKKKGAKQFPPSLLGVAQQSHTPQDPVIWVLYRLQEEREDVGEVRAPWLPVDWTLIEPGLLGAHGVDGIDVDHGEKGEEDLGRGFDEFAVAAVPACTVQEQTVHVDTFWRRATDVFLHESCHVIVEYHAVQGPALVGSGDLLPHGSQEALWIEEAGHPEDVRSTLKTPGVELGIPLDQVSEPETKGRRLPRDLLPTLRHPGIIDVVEGIPEVLAHDDGAVDSQLEVLQGGANREDDPLHPVNLLTQEDIQRG